MSLINTLKGIFIGIALVIPGLSGSIFAVVVGLYDKIIFSINNIRKNTSKSLVFLIPILIGIIIGILVSTKFILWICENYVHQSYSFFTGLVIGSIPFIINKIKKNKNFSFYPVFTLIGFLFIYYISNFNNTDNSNYISISEIKNISDLLKIFFAGLFSCSLMTIPGVSGSIMLMAINQYGTVYNSVGKITDMIILISKGQFESAFQNINSIIIIIPFLLGSFIGILLISKLISFLLIKAEAKIYFGVLGLIIGAAFILIKSGIYPYLFKGSTNNIISSILADTAFCIIGIIICRCFSEKNVKNE